MSEAVSATVVMLVLTVAIIAKLLDWDAFRVAITSYRLLPDILVGPAAWGVTSAEVAILVGSVAHRTRPAGLAACALLMVGFTLLQVLAMARHIGAPCGCFNGLGLERTIGIRSVLRTGSIAVLSLYAALSPPASLGLSAVVLAAGVVGVGVVFTRGLSTLHDTHVSLENVRLRDKVLDV